MNVLLLLLLPIVRISQTSAFMSAPIRGSSSSARIIHLNRSRLEKDMKFHSSWSMAMSPDPLNSQKVTSTEGVSEGLDPDMLRVEAQKFKIMVCGSTSCSKQRRILQMDEYSTFGGLYSRAHSSGVEVEESGCIGSCKKAPCVAVMHEDFMGYVSLEGMRPAEFSDNRFHKVIFEEDLDRVWECVENAVSEMASDNDDDEEAE